MPDSFIGPVKVEEMYRRVPVLSKSVLPRFQPIKSRLDLKILWGSLSIKKILWWSMDDDVMIIEDNSFDVRLETSFRDFIHNKDISLNSIYSGGDLAQSSRSIYLVPEGLKKSNEDAYIPRVVSIGPRFKGSREDLLLVEDIKVRCIRHLIGRTRAEQYVDAIQTLFECFEAIWKSFDKIQSSYLSGTKLYREELVQTMLMDGCFLLELLISKEFDDQLPSLLTSPSPAIEVLRDEDVLSDLTLLENQIPILVIDELSKTLFGNLFGNDFKESATRINNIVLSILGYSKLEVQRIESPHILDIVHFFVNGKDEEKSKAENCINQEHHVVDIIDTQNQQPRMGKLKLKRCALRLLTAGVTIKAILSQDKDSGFALSCFWLVWKSICGILFKLCNILLINGKHLDLDHIPEEVEVKGLDFYFKFEKGKLEIKQLHITKTTKAKWCNLIVWENYKKYKDISSLRDESRQQNTSTTASGSSAGGKFTWAALLFNGLICSEDDVQLLKDKKIVVDHLRMSNQELMEFFRKIVDGIDHTVLDSSSYYIQMVDDINNFSKAIFIKRIWRMVWNSFTYRQEWLVKFLNHNYNFVATLISLCTIVQTIYAIIAYQLPK